MANVKVYNMQGAAVGEITLADEVFGNREVAVEEPAYQTYGKHVAALQHGLVVHARVGQGGLGHRGDGHLEHLTGDAQLGEGVVGDDVV